MYERRLEALRVRELLQSPERFTVCLSTMQQPINTKLPIQLNSVMELSVCAPLLQHVVLSARNVAYKPSLMASCADELRNLLLQV